jgi:lysophospholipase L1-like esterase
VMLGWHPLPDNRNVRSTLTAFLHSAPNTILVTMPTALNRRIARLDLSCYVANRDGPDAFTFCGNLPYSQELQSAAFDYILERNEIVRDISRQTDTPLVDLFCEFDTEHLADFRQEFSDMIHLRPSAYPKIARGIYEGIKHLLQPAISPVRNSGSLSETEASSS